MIGIKAHGNFDLSKIRLISVSVKFVSAHGLLKIQSLRTYEFI